MTHGYDDKTLALCEVSSEIFNAREKHPLNVHLLAALMEEVGELAKELLEHGNSDHARKEAMQVACVAVRIMTEGDEDFGPRCVRMKKGGEA